MDTDQPASSYSTVITWKMYWLGKIRSAAIKLTGGWSRSFGWNNKVNHTNLLHDNYFCGSSSPRIFIIAVWTQHRDHGNGIEEQKSSVIHCCLPGVWDEASSLLQREPLRGDPGSGLTTVLGNKTTRIWGWSQLPDTGFRDGNMAEPLPESQHPTTRPWSTAAGFSFPWSDLQPYKACVRIKHK